MTASRRPLLLVLLAVALIQPNLGPTASDAAGAGRARTWSDPRWAAMPLAERATRKRIVQIAEAEATGCLYHEYNRGQPDNGCANQGTGNGNRYALAIGTDNYVYWCAIFATWVWRSAGASRQSQLSPAVQSILDRNRGTQYWRPGGSQPLPGDISLWKGASASHVNIVVDSQIVDGKVYIKTVGGNESDQINPTNYSLPSGIRGDFQGYVSPFPTTPSATQTPSASAAQEGAAEDGPAAAAPRSVVTIRQDGSDVTVTASPPIAGTTATVEVRSPNGATWRETITFLVGESSRVITIPADATAALTSGP